MIQNVNSDLAISPANPWILQQAFCEFSKASAALENSYHELQLEARRLSEELATANSELQRTLAEKERVRSYLRNILHSLGNGVLVLNASRCVQVSNPNASRILGISEDQLTGSIGDLRISTDLRKWMERAFAAEGHIDELETVVKNGNSKRHVMVSATRLANPDGESGLVFIFTDITRLRELELKTQRDQKLQAMGEMAVELAHEIRNPLGSIDLFASLLSSELTHDERLRQWSEQIVTSVKFLNTIVTNMLTFSRSAVPEFQTLDVVELVHETLDFMDPVFHQRNVEVSRPEHESVYVEGDRQMLWQALINLMMNALQAMPDQGAISIQVCKSKDLAVIAINDSGIGIAPENLDRIFDPFFTTSDKGTGLGLALVHQIVEKHRGAITASSEPGKGSRFTISVPLVTKVFTC